MLQVTLCAVTIKRVTSRMSSVIIWRLFLLFSNPAPASMSFYRDGILKKIMEARNREGIGLSYRPARRHRLAELIPWNRFLGSLKVSKFGLCMSVASIQNSEEITFCRI